MRHAISLELGGGARPACQMSKGRYELFELMADVAKVLERSRKTVERMITDGRLPKPDKLTNGSLVWPLDALVEWFRPTSPHLAAELLVYSQAVDLRPDSIEKTLALSRQYGKKFTHDQVVYGTVKTATPEEAAAVCAAQYAQLGSKEPLQRARSCRKPHGCIRALPSAARDDSCYERCVAERMNLQPPTMSPDAHAYDMAFAVVAASKDERERHKQKPKKAKDAA
jgi:predicted DNA-binding transcriptional regulator AlpA